MERPWADGAAPEQAPLFSEEGDVSRPAADVADPGEFIAIGTNVETSDPPVPPPPARPHLQRNTMQAAPPAPSPAPDPPQSTAVEAAPTDSLSLLQLRRIVAEVNRVEQPAYDFEYSDMGPHAEELDEWFSYQFWQWMRLNSAQRAFEWHWENENSASCKGWGDADNDARARFVQSAIAGVQSNDAALRSASIGKLVYLILGRWGETAMPNATTGDSQSVASISQLRAIKAGVECLTSLEGLPVIWEALKNSFELHWSGDAHQAGSPQEAQDELVNLMTILYVCIQETLNDPEDMSSAYNKLLDLNPSLVDFMMTATSKLRWDDHNIMPHTQIFLLFWKSILLVFGGSKEMQAVKKATSEQVGGPAKETITASPLDYHVFRQEITSKYPAYIPPQPKIPLEAENTSFLPPLPNHTTRTSAANGITPFNANAQNVGSSILNQPVHIATPAPSPPPSPAVGGKGGKKQNYQTNQNFPFMYPPLDATSNSAGGKGMSDLHEALVSRKWEGSDIPASILEAGELFSSRVRMTRATRQLWEEREKFLRYERGWGEDVEEDEIDDLDLNELSLEEREIIQELKAEQEKEKRPLPSADFAPDLGPHPEQLSPRDKRRLEAVEKFYRDALPHLQSLVIVLLRPILANVTAIVAQQPNQQQPGQMGRGMNPGVNGGQVPRPQDGTQQDSVDLSPEDIDAARMREITSKAMTAILLLLLKWLRLSHVLKFEYLTQLLLDSNYIPLVLKLFAHQDIQQVVDSKTDRVENSFFHFCNLRSKSKDSIDVDGLPDDDVDLDDEEIDDGSEDDAVPPPIRRRPNDVDGPKEDDQSLARPEVDELGYPVTSLPEEPITDFSRRNFFSLINYLRVMQKICKNKSHRNLLLVQYKSSTIIRKSLKVPQPELRLYTLKLFKGQVPYCGRKWRQGNMRVITAVYLHCRPELRDEWLAGSDIDSDVDSALPLEQALRGLTHWHNLRRYPDKIAPEIRSVMREEHDFFTRELEKLDFNWADVQADDGMSELDHVEGWA